MRYTLKRGLRLPVHIHIENDWRLGDEILAIPFYQLVRERFPNADITVRVNYPTLLASNASVRVDNSIGEFDCDRFLFAKDDARSVHRLRHLCLRHGIPYAAIEPSVEAGAEVPEFRRAGGGSLIGYSCGAGWVCKSWAPSRLKQVLQRMAESDGAVTFVELGQDTPRVGVGQCLVDALTIDQTATVLRACDLYIGPDSGLVHLALAVGTPAVGLYGPVDPAVAFGPRPGLFPVLSPVACVGCFTSGRMETPGECPLGFRGDSPDDYTCMRSITSDQVLAAIAGACPVSWPSHPNSQAEDDASTTHGIK